MCVDARVRRSGVATPRHRKDWLPKAGEYSTHAKATGTGFALSVGRGGAALSPYLAGLLFSNQTGLMNVSLVMAAGSLIAFALFLFLPAGRHAS
jgi:hypothetical protein